MFGVLVTNRPSFGVRPNEGCGAVPGEGVNEWCPVFLLAEVLCRLSHVGPNQSFRFISTFFFVVYSFFSNKFGFCTVIILFMVFFKLL